MEQLTMLDSIPPVQIGLRSAAQERQIIANQLREQARKYYDYLGAAKRNERQRINSPQDAADIVMYDLAPLDHEELWVLLLDNRNGVIKVHKLYQGSSNMSTVKVGEVFRQAIIDQAAAIIVVHNHPSGDPTPSPDDIVVTQAMVQAGKLLDIDLLDHLVIGAGRFVSLKERGLGFSR